MKRNAAFMFGLFLMPLGAGAADVPPPPQPQVASISLDQAYDAARAALRRCRLNGFPNAAVAVTDSAGTLLVLLRTPGAPTPTIESARRKAYTSARTGLTTTAFAKSKGWTDPNALPSGARRPARPPLNADPFKGLPVFDNDPNLVPWGGGLPIKSGATVLGGIGLSGAAGPKKDEDCTQGGVEAIRRHL